MDEQQEAKEQAERIASITKKGFDLKERLKNRGLRKATITLYLDEEKGVEIGWARDKKNELGAVVGREREGIFGEIDALEEKRRKVDLKDKGLDSKIVELEAKRDEMLEELNKSAIVVNIRAVPPVIQRDCHRKTKVTLNLETKNIPDDMKEEFDIASTAHLMAVMIQRVTDNATGGVNEGIDYDEAIAMMEYLSPGQFHRLDSKLGEVQFTDAISESIEGQEDFS